MRRDLRTKLSDFELRMEELRRQIVESSYCNDPAKSVADTVCNQSVEAKHQEEKQSK